MGQRERIQELAAAQSSWARLCPPIKAIAGHLEVDPTFRVETSAVQTKWDNGEETQFPAIRIKHLHQLGRADVLVFQDDVGNVHAWTEGGNDGQVICQTSTGAEAAWRIFESVVLKRPLIVQQ